MEPSKKHTRIPTFAMSMALSAIDGPLWTESAEGMSCDQIIGCGKHQNRCMSLENHLKVCLNIDDSERL